MERDTDSEEHPPVLSNRQERGAHRNHIHCDHESSRENGSGPQEVPLEKEEQQETKTFIVM